MRWLKPQERQVLDEMLDYIIPPTMSIMGFEVPRDDVKRYLWQLLEQDQFLSLKLFNVYTRLKRLYEVKATNTWTGTEGWSTLILDPEGGSKDETGL